MNSESKRIEYLDSVRGLAALFVLLSHTAGAFAWPATYDAVLRWPFISILFEGKEAVCMFFVLSGYVLSKPYIGSPANAAPRKIFLPTFYLRRFTRIWLPWFFVFVASIFAHEFLFRQQVTTPPVSAWLNQFWQATLTVGDFFRQCAFLLHDPHRQLLNQDWSLGVELKGSILIPLFLFLLRGKRIVFLIVLAVALPICVETGRYYVSFIIGVLLARYGEFAAVWLWQAGRLTKVLFLIGGLSLYQTFGVVMFIFHETLPAYQCGWIATSLGCALILVAIFGSKSLQQWLSRKPMIFLGRISYSVYLLQFIVILCLLPQSLECVLKIKNGLIFWGI